jgi:hypothetical protein
MKDIILTIFTFIFWGIILAIYRYFWGFESMVSFGMLIIIARLFLIESKD